MISKSFSVDAAHILELPYESKCNRLHGHTYKITVFIKQPEDTNGMEYDYTLFPKDRITAMDHKLLVARKHLHLHDGIASINIGSTGIRVPESDIYIINGPNTTAECIAKHISMDLRQNGFPAHHVTVSETEQTTARYP